MIIFERKYTLAYFQRVFSDVKVDIFWV